MLTRVLATAAAATGSVLKSVSLPPSTFGEGLARLHGELFQLTWREHRCFVNELEWVRGEILANVWETSVIVRIDPRSGEVLGHLDLSGLPEPPHPDDPDAVLNGIAYDAAGDRLFVTGKRWRTVFEIGRPGR